MNPECYTRGACVECGCRTTALQMCNKACEGGCYPPMMSKYDWDDAHVKHMTRNEYHEYVLELWSKDYTQDEEISVAKLRRKGMSERGSEWFIGKWISLCYRRKLHPLPDEGKWKATNDKIEDCALTFEVEDVTPTPSDSTKELDTKELLRGLWPAALTVKLPTPYKCSLKPDKDYLSALELALSKLAWGNLGEEEVLSRIESLKFSHLINSECIIYIIETPARFNGDVYKLYNNGSLECLVGAETGRQCAKLFSDFFIKLDKKRLNKKIYDNCN